MNRGSSYTYCNMETGSGIWVRFTYIVCSGGSTLDDSARDIITKVFALYYAYRTERMTADNDWRTIPPHRCTDPVPRTWRTSGIRRNTCLLL